jgi:hypothetical protein
MHSPCDGNSQLLSDLSSHKSGMEFEHSERSYLPDLIVENHESIVCWRRHSLDAVKMIPWCTDDLDMVFVILRVRTSIELLVIRSRC